MRLERDRALPTSEKPLDHFVRHNTRTPAILRTKLAFGHFLRSRVGGRFSAFWFADGADFSGGASTTIEEIAAVGFKAAYADARRHFHALQNLASFGIDMTEIALLPFPGAVPEFTIDPGDAGHETIRLDRFQDFSRFRIDLVNLSIADRPTQSEPSAHASPESRP